MGKERPHLVLEEMRVALDGIAVGERAHFVLEHFLRSANTMGGEDTDGSADTMDTRQEADGHAHATVDAIQTAQRVTHLHHR